MKGLQSRPQHRIICNADLKRYAHSPSEACDNCPLVSNGSPCIRMQYLIGYFGGAKRGGMESPPTARLPNSIEVGILNQWNYNISYDINQLH